MNKNTAKNLILKTRDDYNLIAEQFSSTRHYIWSDFEKITAGVDFKGKRVLDLGCGNGRLFDFLYSKGISEYYGFDQSEELIKIAKKRYPKGMFKVGNMLDTGYKDNDFDIVLCLATLHHIPSKNLREAALKESFRILKPGGLLITTNWYFWNKRKYLLMILKSLLKNKLPLGDFFMPWKVGAGDTITERYFHAWTKRETKRLLKRSGFSKIKIHGMKNSIWFKLGNNLITICKK